MKMRIVKFNSSFFGVYGIDKEVDYATFGLKTLYERKGSMEDLNKSTPETRACEKIFVCMEPMTGNIVYEQIKESS